MRARAIPPARIDMARVREELRERERAAEEEARIQAALRAEAQVQALALTPEGGWWRHGKGGQKLRRRAVMDATSVGCSVAQVAKASGATPRQVHSAIGESRVNPNGPGSTDQVRDWPAILQAAHEKGICAARVARMENVNPTAVYVQCARLGITLPRGIKDPWSAEEEQFAREHYKQMSTRTLAATLNRTYTSVRAKVRRLGLQTPRAQHGADTSTATHDPK